MRSAMRLSLGDLASNCMTAFEWPRWSPEGDVEVDSRQCLIPLRKSSVEILVSIDPVGSSRLQFLSIDLVASVVEMESMSYVPSKIAWLAMLVAYGPRMSTIGGNVNGVPSA